MNLVRLLFVLLAFGVFAVRAQSPDDQYIGIYQMIQDADRLNGAGQKREAAAKYIEAQGALRRFQSIYPGWNERVINYRLSYVAGKLAPLTASIAAAPATNAPAAAPTNVPPTVATTPPPATATTPPPATTTAPPPVQPPAPPAPSPELQQQLASLQQELEQVRDENNRLGAKLKEALSVQPAAVDPRELTRAQEQIRGLEKENELLKVRVKMATTPADGEGLADLRAKLAQQADVVAALRSENDILRKREMQAASIGTEAMANADAQVIQNLRARVSVLEAKPLPYSPEELALLSPAPAVNTPPSTLVASTATPPPAEGPKKVSKELPPGTGPLVAAAERAFATGNFAEAEQKYQEVLRQDEDNVSMLANVASTQLELGRVEEAEKNVMKALAGDPGDYFALYVLGRVKFRQDKLDEALDALSRSAQANPDYAETQNYLGIVLSEKGLRLPAEAALRRAVQIQPTHAAAHNNLAVVYATQVPPAMALAKWHYQKALAAGHARNVDLEKIMEEKR